MVYLFIYFIFHLQVCEENEVHVGLDILADKVDINKDDELSGGVRVDSNEMVVVPRRSKREKKPTPAKKSPYTKSGRGKRKRNEKVAKPVEVNNVEVNDVEVNDVEDECHFVDENPAPKKNMYNMSGVEGKVPIINDHCVDIDGKIIPILEKPLPHNYIEEPPQFEEFMSMPESTQ